MGPSVDNRGRLEAAACCPVLLFCFVETESHHVAQASLELEIPLPQLPGNYKCLDGKYIPPGLIESIHLIG